MPDYGPLYQTAGQAWNIDPLLLQAMAGKESNETPSATNPKSGAQGMMQFLPTTAPQYGVKDPYNAQQSVIGAARYMDTLLKQHNGDLSAALADYSGNAGNPNAPYVKDVTGRYSALQQAWGTAPPGATQPSASPSDGTSAPQPITDVTKQAGFGTKFGKFADNGVPEGMIIHHTAGRGSVDSVLNTYKSTNFPAPFIIDRQGNIYQAIPDGYQGQHIRNGTGPVGEGKSNANMEGVEIIANDDKDVLPVQQQAAANLLQQRADKWGWVNPQALVYGHGEVNPGHKEPDEGMTVAGGVRNGTLQLPSFAGGPAQGVQVASNSKTTQATATDFKGSLFGNAPSPQQTTPAPAAAAPSGDFKGNLFGAPPAPAAAPAAAPPAEPATVEGSPVSPAPAAPAAPAGDATTPSAEQPVTAPQRSWLERNVTGPLYAMYNPLASSVTTPGATTNYLLQQPFMQNIGGGIAQGARNVAQRLNEFEQWADRNYPSLANLDRNYGAAADQAVAAGARAIGLGSLVTPPTSETPDALAARGNRLAGESQAYRTQYGDSLAATGGEIAGNLLATYPLAAPVWALRTAGEAVPLLRGATEVATAGGTPAAQNILTTPGEDWRAAGAEGAAGGLAVHGVLGSVANQFTRGAVSQAVQDARNLGFELTTGEASGGLAKNIEDVTQYLPGSGAAAKAAEHRTVINGILNRNMGNPNAGPVLNQATMQTARANAGNLMNRINSVTVDVNRDPNLLNELSQIHAEAAAQPMTGSSITGAIDDILDTASNRGGTLPGAIVHNLIKSGTPLDRLTSSPDAVIRQFAQRIQTSIQDAQSRTGDPAIYGTTQAAANQAAVDAFNQGRYFWKTIKTVEPLVDKTGSADDASYAGLARRIEGTAKNPNFDPRFSGQNHDMDTLARVLRGPLAKLQESGTGRQMITAGLLGLGGGEGGLGMATHIFAPQNFGTYLQDVVMPTVAAIGGGRILRYGPGMGLAPVEAARQVFNPLLPRVAGPAVATNRLLTDQQQGQ